MFISFERFIQRVHIRLSASDAEPTESEAFDPDQVRTSPDGREDNYEPQGVFDGNFDDETKVSVATAS